MLLKQLPFPESKDIRRTAVLVSLLALIGFVTVACNTTEGFGEDVEALGDSIDDAAEDAKD